MRNTAYHNRLDETKEPSTKDGAKGGYRISHQLRQVTERNVTRWKSSYYLQVHT